MFSARKKSGQRLVDPRFQRIMPYFYDFHTLRSDDPDEQRETLYRWDLIDTFQFQNDNFKPYRNSTKSKAAAA